MSSALRIAPAVVLLATSSAVAGIETVPVIYTISGTSDLLGGDFTFQAEFETVYDQEVSFESAAGSFGSNASYAFSYTDLSTMVEDEFIDSTFGLLAVGSGGDITADVSMSGFATDIDGNVMSGIGILTMSNIGSFTPETMDVTWSITLVPAPGALALLGVAGLSRRRRRD